MLKPFLIFGLLTASAWAANLNIKASDFSGKEPLVVTKDIPLIPEFGGKLLVQSPGKLEPGYLYLRKKIDAQHYAFYKGKPANDASRILKTFRPQGAPPDSFLFTKFFGTRIAKAFQDEAEVYFDRNYIYSSRVVSLFYDEKGQWIEIKSVVLGMGAVECEAAPPAYVILEGDSLGLTPVRAASVSAGFHGVKWKAPGFLPVVTGVVVSAGLTAKKSQPMLPLSAVEFLPPFPVSMDTLLDANQLPELEPFWDRLQYNKQQYEIFLSQQKQKFDGIYPKLMSVPKGIPVGDLGYIRYRDLYLQTRDEAYGLFLSAIVSGAKELEQGLQIAQTRKDSLESLLMEERVLLDTASFGKKDKGIQAKLKLRSKDMRMDFVWEGTWLDTAAPSDSLYSALKDPLGWSSLVVQLQNHPVKLSIEQIVARRHYRFLKLFLVSGEKRVELKGSFALPEYVLKQEEVQAWLNRDKAPKDGLKAAKPSKQMDEPKAWVKAYRGDVLEIDGGLFRYKGKSVMLSPYAIQKTEVTQEHFQRIMLQNPAATRKHGLVGAKKPAHNVNWEEAQGFCESIGGGLPTEAQWEFAARAGSNDGQLWKSGAIKQLPSAHAIYWDNSGSLPSKDPGFGPQKVAGREPNAWGIYDMSGNVAEWTQDLDSWFHFYVDTQDPKGAWLGADYVFKGGSWKNSLKEIDLLKKDYEDPRYWGPTLGLRCAFPSHQVLHIDSIKAFLRGKDSLAKAEGITLLGGPIQMVIESLSNPAQAPVPTPTPTPTAKPIPVAGTAPVPAVKPAPPVTAPAPVVAPALTASPAPTPAPATAVPSPTPAVEPAPVVAPAPPPPEPLPASAAPIP